MEEGKERREEDQKTECRRKGIKVGAKIERKVEKEEVQGGRR